MSEFKSWKDPLLHAWLSGSKEAYRALALSIASNPQVSDHQIAIDIHDLALDPARAGTREWSDILIEEVAAQGRKKALYSLAKSKVSYIRGAVYQFAPPQVFVEIVDEIHDVLGGNEFLFAIQTRLERTSGEVRLSEAATVKALEKSKGSLTVLQDLLDRNWNISEELMQRLLKDPDRRVRLLALQKTEKVKFQNNPNARAEERNRKMSPSTQGK